MADIPPIASSAAQAGFQQADVSKTRNAERSAQSIAANKSVKAMDASDTSIETTDTDTAVFSDAEGMGGQGRSEEEQLEHGVEQDGADAPGVQADDDGNLHLDVQA